MTNEAIRLAVAETLASSWATATAIGHPNRNFDPPIDQAWIKYYILKGEPQEGEKKGVGIRNGAIMIDINVPLNTGTQTLNGLSDRLELIFRNVDIDGVQCEEPYTRELGEVGGYYNAVTIVSFHTFVGE